METNAAEQWITARLKADTALTAVVDDRIYNTTRGGDVPCVIFQLQAPQPDFMVLGGERVWASLLYLVRGIAEGVEGRVSFEGDVATIANRIDAVLHKASGSNAAGTVFSCVRVRPFKWSEVPNGRPFAHLGGIYEIKAR